MSPVGNQKTFPFSLEGATSSVGHKLLFAKPEGSKRGFKRMEELEGTVTGFSAGSVVVGGTKEDGSFIVTYEEISDSLPLPTTGDNGNAATRKEIKINIAGVMDVIGYFITDTKEIGVQLNVLGIVIGSFYGNAEKGLTVQLDLLLVQGTATFYIGNAALAGKKALRVKYSLKSIFFVDSLAEGDAEILKI